MQGQNKTLQGLKLAQSSFKQLIPNSSPFPAHAASHVRSRSLAISGKPVLTPPDVFMQTSESLKARSTAQQQIYKIPYLTHPH